MRTRSSQAQCSQVSKQKTSTKQNTPRQPPDNQGQSWHKSMNPDSYTGANNLYKQGLKVPRVRSSRVRQESNSTFCVSPRSNPAIFPWQWLCQPFVLCFRCKYPKMSLFLASFTRLSSSWGLFLPLLAIQPWVRASPIFCTYQYF